MLLLSLCACGDLQPPDVEETEAPAVSVEEPDEVVESGFAPETEQAIADLVKMYGAKSDGYSATPYVVCDFDNTTAVFNITMQCCVYQLERMAFAVDPEGLQAALSASLDLEAGDNADWIADITAAYAALYEAYGPFTAAGLRDDRAAAVQADPQWQEFAAKMRALISHVQSTLDAPEANAWVLWRFTGMTEQEVYDLFYRSCMQYRDVETERVTWTSPETLESRLGVVETSFTRGVSVPQEVADMLRTLRTNGIDVWVCSASHADGVRAAVDAFGLSDVVTGVIGMTQQISEGVFVPDYDYETGYSYDNAGEGVWTRSEYLTGAIPSMEGKVTAIRNALMPRYRGAGPIAGFMDSGSDFNFCTEFTSLKLVVCFNRANRKITDGAGLIAVVAVYQRDVLHYDLAKANEEGDTLFILQGRDENGLRTLRASDHTIRLGETEPSLFANADNQVLLDYARTHKLTTQQLIDGFCIATPANDLGNLLSVDHGHLQSYSGYHSIPDEPLPPEEPEEEPEEASEEEPAKEAAEEPAQTPAEEPAA